MTRILSAVVALCLAATAGLGYLWWDLRQDFDSRQQVLDHQLQEAGEHVSQMVAEATAEMPDVDVIRSDVSQLQSDVDRHEKALQDAADLFEGQAKMDRLQDQQVEALKSCVNNSFGKLEDYSRGIAVYVGLVATGGIGVRPYLLSPRCY
jgi:hypothetical protein